VNYRLNGEKFWNRLTIYPFGGKPGKPDFYVGNQVDITNIRIFNDVAASQLISIRPSIDAASLQINEAINFSRSLRDQLASEDSLSAELDHFLHAEQSSLQQLQCSVAEIQDMIQRASAEQQTPLKLLRDDSV
jgi:septal ring factor EnvC (AmiA/AmiB activator)